MDHNEIYSICACISLYHKPISVLEWGSGSSTLYFPKFLSDGGSWHSVEHDSEFAKQVKAQLKKISAKNVTISYVGCNRPYVEGFDDGDFETFRDYVLYPSKFNTTFSIILVDGRARVDCMKIGWQMLDQDGIMILHDAQRKEYQDGLPRDCYYFKIINKREFNEGFKTTTFICKSFDRIEKLYKTINEVVEDHIVFEGDLLNGDSPKIKNQKPEKRIAENDTRKHPSIIFLNTYYHQFLQDFYRKYPNNNYAQYHFQLNNLQNQFFGDSDFYSTNLNKFGWSSEDIIVNCEPLQLAWLKSNNIKTTKNGIDIAVEQIIQKRPDVVYFQNLGLAVEQFIEKIRPYTELIVGQIASSIPQQINLRNFDIIFSSFPHFVEFFRSSGLTSYYQRLAFDPRVLDKVKNKNQKYDVTFVGGITPDHGDRIKFLEHLAKKLPLKVWGYGYHDLPPGSDLKTRFNGEAWGLDMFRILMDSRITINHHINTSDEYANNMRLYEATGCGALLITDYKENLSTLFDIGKEVITYRSLEECVDLIQYYLNNPLEASTIAKKGQARTLKEHNYEARMENTSEILKRHLAYKRLRTNRPPIDMSKISYGYERIENKNITVKMENAWKSEKIPQLQRDLIQVELDNMYHGKEPVVYQALADCIRPYTHKYGTVAEIGCASGYYSEILEYLLNTQIDYVGIDYSKHLIQMAKNYYPEDKFCVADGAFLPFEENQFQMIISSGILLHVPNFEEHIRETVRVCENVLIAHRTPVCRKRETQHFKKMAYEEETIEMRFNENQLLKMFFSCGMSLVNCKEFYIDIEKDNYEITYVFEKSPIVNKMF